MDTPLTRKTVFALLLVLAVATRFWGLGWGLPNTYHADENFFAQKAIRFIDGDLNPHFFHVGTLHMYILAGMWKAYYYLGKGTGTFQSTPQFMQALIDDPTMFYKIGRAFSAVSGVGVVLLIFLIGLRMFNLWAGAAAGLFMTFSPEHIKISHAMLPDGPTLFFLVLTFYLIWMIYKTGRTRYYVLAGLTAGAAMAMKYAGHMMAVPLFLAHVFRVLENGLPKKRILLDGRLFLFGGAFLLIFAAGCPYAVLDFKRFLQDFRWQSEHLLTQGHFGSSMEQPAWLFYLQFGFRDNLGSWVQYLAYGGVILALARRKALEWILLAYPVVLFLFIGAWKTRATRYFLPVAPFFILLAALFVNTAADWTVKKVRGSSRLRGPDLRTAAGWTTELSQRLFGRPGSAPRAVAALTLLFALVSVAPSAVRAVRYDASISGLDTRTVARDWVHFNIPAGEKIAIEMYDPPISREKYATIYRHSLSDLDLEWLQDQGARYVIISDINYARFTRFPDEFPGRAAFYFDLEKEATLIKTFEPAYNEDLLDLHNPTIKIYRLSRAVDYRFPGHFARYALDAELTPSDRGGWRLRGSLAASLASYAGERVSSPYIRVEDAAGRSLGRLNLLEGDIPGNAFQADASTILSDLPEGARIILGYEYSISPNPLREPPERPFQKEFILPEKVDHAVLRGGNLKIAYRFGAVPASPAGPYFQAVSLVSRGSAAALWSRVLGPSLRYKEGNILDPFVELRDAQGALLKTLTVFEGKLGALGADSRGPVEKKILLRDIPAGFRIVIGHRGGPGKEPALSAPLSIELSPPLPLR
jgi:hypothetical protein